MTGSGPAWTAPQQRGEPGEGLLMAEVSGIGEANSVLEQFLPRLCRSVRAWEPGRCLTTGYVQSSPRTVAGLR